MKEVFIIKEEMGYDEAKKEWTAHVEKYGIYTEKSSHCHQVRGNLSKKIAENLARELNKLALAPLTNPDCPYCHGIHGCHVCRSEV